MAQTVDLTLTCTFEAFGSHHTSFTHYQLPLQHSLQHTYSIPTIRLHPPCIPIPCHFALTMAATAAAVLNTSRRCLFTSRALRFNPCSHRPPLPLPLPLVTRTAAQPRRHPLHRRPPPPLPPPQCHVTARSLFSTAAQQSASTPTVSSGGHTLEQQEASLVSQLPSHSQPQSAPLSSASCRPIVRQLLECYLAQHKYGDAERLLWRLCDEQTRGGAASTAAGRAALAADGDQQQQQDDDAIDAIRTMASIVNVRRSAASTAGAAVSGSSPSGAALGVLDDLIDRYHTLTASSSSAVIDHPANINFVASISRQYIDDGQRERAERVLRSSLLSDESDAGLGSEAELADGRRLRYATAYNFLGIAAYNPPEHVHSEACAHGHGHAHADEELKQYDWSASQERWKRALSYLSPFIARLSSAHTPASLSSLFTPDSVSLHMLRTFAMTEDNISQAQFTSGREEEAVATLRRSLDALSALLPSHHTELLRVRHQLIRLHLAANNVSQAQKECEPILALDHRLLSLDLTASMDDLADSFFRLRQYQSAARLFQHCIAVRESAAVSSTGAGGGAEAGNEASGSVGDLITASRYNDLAMCELKLNQHAAAEEHLRRSIAIKESQLGADHWECAVSVHNLGAALMGQQRYQEAEVELQRAMKLYQAKYERQQSTERDREAVQAIVASHLGQCYALMERWPDSVSSYQRAVAIKQRTMGDHPSAAMDLTQLGGVLLQSGQYSEAVSAFERVRAMAERMYGGEHTNVAVALHWLSMAEGRASRLEEAVEHARQAVGQGERLHAAGAMQLNTLDVMKKNLTEQLHAYETAGEANAQQQRKASTKAANHPLSR